MIKKNKKISCDIEKNSDVGAISCSLRKMDMQGKMTVPYLNMKILKLQK